ncbi:MAG: hypothetical protein QOE55_3570 [Acidobacteriaceae bacterium]|jgi:hypothetical protein|nr:hypothetical protein [Acidobacteriaceae bacterium]
MIRKSLVLIGALPLILMFGLAEIAAAQAQPQVIDDSQLHAFSTAIGGASVLSTTRTVQHWFGSTLDPHNGVTYGYNMVGADPNNCTGAACSATITADIIPLIVVVDGMTFSGEDVLAATLASPVFELNDYGSTPFATAAGAFPNAPSLIRGPGGLLSQDDAGKQLQLQDATMRAQFNQTGSSPFHLKLNPVTHEAITIIVPSGKGTLLQSGRGVVFADVNIQWWSTRIQNLVSSLDYIDPTHLPIFLTNDTVNFIGTNPVNCCVIGFHGAGPVPSKVKGSNGPVNGNGNQPIQTFAWASWVSPGFFARPNGGTDWALQDIHPLSHEISEWADDPFINNFVEPYLNPTAGGCSNILETGDPVVAIGFAKGTNTFEQGPNPNGTQSADGFYHPEDEVHLPWFMRLAPNTVSEPTQTSSTNIGRYTFMGNLNPFPDFQQPAMGCP